MYIIIVAIGDTIRRSIINIYYLPPHTKAKSLSPALVITV